MLLVYYAFAVAQSYSIFTEIIPGHEVYPEVTAEVYQGVDHGGENPAVHRSVGGKAPPVIWINEGLLGRTILFYIHMLAKLHQLYILINLRKQTVPCIFSQSKNSPEEFKHDI